MKHGLGFGVADRVCGLGQGIVDMLTKLDKNSFFYGIFYCQFGYFFDTGVGVCLLCGRLGIGHWIGAFQGFSGGILVSFDFILNLKSYGKLLGQLYIHFLIIII